MANKLAAGTRFRLIGSNESDPILVLTKDAEIVEISNQAMVGTIIDDQENWDLNIASIPGNWNRVTGAAEPPETNDLAVPEMGATAAKTETKSEPKSKKAARKKINRKKATKKSASKAEQKES